MAGEVNTVEVRVQAMRLEADHVWSFELRAISGKALPSFTAGAHIDVMLPDGLERSYSLLNAPAETDRYVIAVKREAESRGGSAFMCGTLRVGDVLRIKPPSNNFALDESAPLTVLIAGGIGITPLLSMIHRLTQLGRAWRLYYAASCRAAAPFQALLAPFEDRVRMLFDDEGTERFELSRIIAGHENGTQFYCCGPAGMLHAFEAATAGLPPGHAHVEYFTSDLAAAAGGFEVVLARSGRSVKIPGDKTILETLLLEGMNLPRSCMEGVCGTCETVVLEGIPDHRDHVLSAREKRMNKKMMICRSGCLGDRLVLDL